MLFKTKDRAELMDVADSVAGEINTDEFLKVYDTAIGSGDEHQFLSIDLHRKKSHPSMFRRRFNEFLIPDKKNVCS